MTVYFSYGFEHRGRKAEEVRWLKKRALQKARLHRHQRGKLADRLDEIEESLAEQALLNQALLKLSLAKGLFRREDFIVCLRALDRSDGAEDGQLARGDEGAKP